MLFLRPPTSNHGPGVIHCSFVLEPLPVTHEAAGSSPVAPANSSNLHRI